MHRAPILRSLVLLGLASSLAAQDIHVKIVNRFNPRGGRLSGVWGISTREGREYALVGHVHGTWIVDTTDPSQPVEVAHFRANSSNWRELTAYRRVVYSVSEHHRGIRVLDLRDPARPVDKGYMFTREIPQAHTISLDPDAGRLYVSGTNNGQLIFDVRSDPLRPKLLAYYRGAYVHDCHIRRGFAYSSHIYSGNLQILDVSNPLALRSVGGMRTPGGFTHSAWVTRDDEVLVTVDENTNPSGYGLLQLWDIRDKTKPVKKGFYTIGTPEICHNPYVLGRVAYMAYNSAGFHMCDLTDLDKPDKLASFDSNKNIRGYTGMWGCYPFADSGIVYGTDRENGLQVMQIHCAHMNRFGVGTAPPAHAIPRVEFDGAAPRVGASKLEMRISGLRPRATFLLALSRSRISPITLLGVQVNVDVNRAVIVRGRADAAGELVLPTPVPMDHTIAGKRVYMQLFGADAAAPEGLSASRGMWVGICPR